MTELQNLSNESSPKNHMVGRPNKDIYINERLEVVDNLNNNIKKGLKKKDRYQKEQEEIVCQ